MLLSSCNRARNTLIYATTPLENAIKRCDLDKYFYKTDGQAFAFFNEENRQNLEFEIRNCMEVQDDAMLNELCNELIKLPAKRAAKSLLSYLLEQNIKYVPIERKKSEWDNFLQLLDKTEDEKTNFEIILKHEKDRIDTMIDNIYHHAIQPLQNTGGIIICNIGNLHAHRLAANLHARCKISSIALYCYSDQQAKNINDHLHNLNISKLKIDSNEIRQLYEDIPYMTLHFESDDKNEFKNKEFDEIIISHINMKTSHQITLKQGLAYGGALAIVGLFCFKLLSQADIQPCINSLCKKS
jgi:hypothetical protein